MQSNKTVVLGEASEESDSEDFELGNPERPSDRPRETSDPSTNPATRTDSPDSADDKSRPFGRVSLFASIGQTGSTFSKLTKYYPYDLLNSSLGSSNLGPGTTRNKDTAASSVRPNDLPSSLSSDSIASKLSRQSHEMPLHRSLHVKSQQMRASINHLYKHPLQVASKGMHTMSQRLVQNQRTIQEVDEAIQRIKREQPNLDIALDMIV